LLFVEGAFAWIRPIGGITEKSKLVWQDVQVALADVGMWLVGFAAVVKLVVLAWQFEQSPPTGCAASVILYVPPAALGRA
jgi:hypothetical protein